MSSERTSRLNLPYLMPAQAQKHVTHNEAIAGLDELTQLSVVSRSVIAPPADPQANEAYLLPASPNAQWQAHGNQIASMRDGAWHYHTPQAGWRVWIEDEAVLILLDEADGWITVFDKAFPPGDLGAIDTLGLNTSADNSNRLSVASDATLLTHENSDHRLKINKDSASDTASILFQSGFSGRAEMGLAGEDNFSFKVSPDGNQFEAAILINRDTAKVSFPKTATSTINLAARYTLHTDLRWVTSSDDNFGTNYYVAAEPGGTGTDPVIEWEQLGHFLPKNTKVHRIHLAGRVNGSDVTDLEIYYLARHPDLTTRWESGYSSDAQNVITDIHRDFFIAPVTGGNIFSGAITTIHKRTVETNFIMPEDGYFSIFIKPIGTLTTTRYFSAAMTCECSL